MNKKVLSVVVLVLAVLAGSFNLNTATAFAADVKVLGIKLDKSDITLEKGDFTYITAQTDPKKATNKKIRYKSLNSKVASVTNKGKITAVSAGETFIAASTVDGGYMKFCKVTVTDKSGSSSSSNGTPSIKRTANSWTVEGQWAFVIDSVNTHYDCANTNDNTVGSVIMVTYSYMNLGYSDAQTGLTFSPKSIRIMDTNGIQGKYYRCEHATKPAELMEKGEICTATAAYSFPNTGYSKTYNINVSKTIANGDPKTNLVSATFAIEPGGSWSEDINKASEYDKKQKIRTYMEKYGSLDTNTNRVITRTENGNLTQITYKSSTDTFSFLYRESASGTTTSVSFDLGASEMSANAVDFEASTVINSAYAVKGVFTMTPRLFKRTDTCYYSVSYTGTNGYTSRDENHIKTFGAKTVTALDSISMLLFEACGLTVKDIGFEVYN